MQQQGLRQAHLGELPQVQALVGAVRPGVGVLHAGDQHGRLRVGSGQLRDERDGPADADVDRFGAEGVAKGAPRGVVRRSRRRQLDRCRPAPTGHADLGAPGGVVLQVPDEGVHGALRVVARRDAQAYLGPGARDQHVGRVRDTRRVQSDDAHRGTGPQPVGK